MIKLELTESQHRYIAEMLLETENKQCLTVLIKEEEYIGLWDEFVEKYITKKWWGKGIKKKEEEKK